MKCSILTLAMVAFLSHHCFSQSISIGYGRTDQFSKSTTPVLYGKNYSQVGNSSDQWIVSLDYSYRKLSFIINYSNYDGVVELQFPDIYKYTKAFASERINRFDFGMGYPLLSVNRKIYITPYLTLGLQHSKWLGATAGDFFKIQGPEYYELNDSSVSSTNTQLVPSIGIKFGFKIGKSLLMGFNFQGVYASKPFSTLYIDYYHKDSPNTIRQAVSKGTGTGIYSSISLGFLIRSTKRNKQ